ncbi:NAD-dependent protein deacetylase [Halostella sp. JP-L12]|uniref:SIR2 family NAD-dependent protein deacylase n=1 Tax=Halostella TaxID=1843185 RepID=UPI000EF81A86|nr:MULTISPECIES: Sir2 family NAD-dependent protein deacetylase [Halostella]NHN48311.1 NAD-dependent protein deacetylase [Halostella sp. JP-L12]
MNQRVDAVARALADADVAVALTGAGVSTASGLPDFRGDDDLWERYDADDFHVRRFLAEPGPFWEDWLDLHAEIRGDVAPNAAHEALADLEAAGHLDAVVTQNVDGLHGDAGSERVIELHGSGDRTVCRDCGATQDTDAVVERVADAAERRSSDSDSSRADGETPPRCDCGGLLKPDTVLFGERLPEAAHAEARMLVGKADAVLVAGTSLTVEPAASLPRRVDDGATLAVVNHDPTSVEDRADHVFRGDVTEVLPTIRDAV